MTNKMKTVLLTLLFVAFIAIAAFAYNNLSQTEVPLNNIDVAENNSDITQREKIKAPDFAVLDSNSNTVKLSELVGKPIVLNFWASWCPPCKSEMPDFDKVYRELGQDVIFMMVDLVDGGRETKEKGAKYVQDQGFAFPIYFDTTQQAAYAYSITSIPTTVFIDKDGYIVSATRGAINQQALKNGILSIMD